MPSHTHATRGVSPLQPHLGQAQCVLVAPLYPCQNHHRLFVYAPEESADLLTQEGIPHHRHLQHN